jgi:putative lipoic acid-binding regulatory protein
MNYICIYTMENKNSEEFYAKLKIQLADTSLWPSKYLYKFIVPTQGTQISEIEALFDNTGAVIATKESSKGKYTSVSIVVNMKNPDAVISKYKEVSKVKGVISL